jgi:transposase-like protein
MSKSKEKWTKETLEAKVRPLFDQKWTVAEVARSLGMSRQRMYKLCADLGVKVK